MPFFSGESRSESVLCLLQLPLWDHFLQEAGLDCTLLPWVTPCPGGLSFWAQIQGLMDEEDIGDQWPLADWPRRLALRI